MDIEHLSKSQIILLTLLISFVTSIATGIVTVSLMDQAPPVIAQTVNRVIERTIQTVASSTPAKVQAAATTVVTQEKTIIVKDSDLVSGAVSKIAPSIVHVYTSGSENATLLSIGFVIDSVGTMVTDNEPLTDRGEVVVALPDGVHLRAFVIRRDPDNGFAFLQIASSTLLKPLTWSPATIATSQALLGQTVIGISGKTVPRIAPGVITAIVPVGGGRIIDTNISSDALLPGSPIINTEGAVVGVSTSASRASSPQGFVPSSVLVSIAPTAKK